MDDASITPLAVPSEARTLIVFGGTFDPPHWGHVKPAVEARVLSGLGDAWLVYVPAARSPHKDTGPVFADAGRVELLTRAIEGVNRAAIWTDELDRARGGATYTIDTLRRLRRLRPGATLRLLIGADQALALHRWREPREIVATAAPIIMLRGGVEASRANLVAALESTGAWSTAELAALATSVVSVTPVTASATAIRAALARGVLDPETLEMLPRSVAAALLDKGFPRNSGSSVVP
ncbi:MAG TPA: nicotinate-nicotinamide nucleotide adenylyltransferase [Phycisphaerales bacterium]